MARVLVLLALLQAVALAHLQTGGGGAQQQQQQAARPKDETTEHAEHHTAAKKQPEEEAGRQAGQRPAAEERPEDHFARRAEAAIAGMSALAESLEEGLGNGSKVEGWAEALVARTLEDFRDRREEALSKLRRNMEALGPSRSTSLSAAEAEVVARAASKAGDELSRLGREELHAVSSGLRKHFRSDLAVTRGLWRKARKDVRHAEQHGHVYVKALIKAGAKEDEYEGAELKLQEACERLRARAEEAAERAESLSEERFDRIWAALEPMLKNLQDDLSVEQAAREDRLRELTNALRVSSRAQAHSEKEAKVQAQPQTLAAAAAAPFLAAVLTTVLVALAMIFSLALAVRRQPVPFSERPVLG